MLNIERFNPIFQDTFAPVSYTHLDVYKRQSESLSFKHQGNRRKRPGAGWLYKKNRHPFYTIFSIAGFSLKW